MDKAGYFHQRWQAVLLIAPDGSRLRFRNTRLAAEHLGLSKNAVLQALNNGHRCKGHVVRFGDMAEKYQTKVKPPRERPIRCGDRVSTISKETKTKVEWMRLFRAIRRGKSYNGLRWVRIGEDRKE